MSTVLLFPGQGSQTSGMREVVERHAPDLLDLVLDEVGADPFELVDEGTMYAQPAIVCASLALWDRAGRPEAAFLAGHSLGELSALAAGGAMSAVDAVRLAVVRGKLMQDAGGKAPGGMMALLGDGDEARAAVAASDVSVANDNGPTQLVVAGPEAALDVAAAEAKARGVRTMRLAVRGAFHSPAIESAVAPYRNALERDRDPAAGTARLLQLHRSPVRCGRGLHSRAAVRRPHSPRPLARDHARAAGSGRRTLPGSRARQGFDGHGPPCPRRRRRCRA